MVSIRLVRESPSEMIFSHAHLAGWFFLVMGAGMAYFGLGLLEEDDKAGRWMLAAVGTLFGVIGLFAALWRHELTLDLLSRTYRGRRGFWPSPKTLRGSLEELEGAVLERGWRRSSSSEGGSRESVVWNVLLDFGEWNVPVFESQDESRAYARLEHYAKLLRVPAIDRNGAEERRRSWDELDRSVADRARSRGESVAAPDAPPPGSRIVWDPAPGMATIILPPFGFSGAMVFLILFGLAFAGFAGLFILALSGLWDVPVSGSRAVGWTLGTVFLLIGLAIVLGALWGSFAREVIREERDGMLFYLTLLGRRYRRRFLPRREIEEVSLELSTASRSRRRGRIRAAGTSVAIPEGSIGAAKAGREVVVRSDRHVIKLGGELEPEGQQWLLEALTHLAAR